MTFASYFKKSKSHMTSIKMFMESVYYDKIMQGFRNSLCQNKLTLSSCELSEQGLV